MKSKKHSKRFSRRFFSFHSFVIHLFLFALIGGIFYNFIFPSEQALAQKVSTNEIIVKFKPLANESTRLKVKKELGGTLKTKINPIRIEVLKVPDGAVDNFVKAYKKSPYVEYAEPNAVAEKTGITNDPSLPSQWGLYSIDAAQSGGDSAWDITSGSSSVKIAILDTGIDPNHADLQGKIIATSNFTDSSSSADVDGHGTHVAGIAAAATNNGIGVAGTGYNSSLMNGKVLGDTGSGYYSWIANGIVWAADNGAQVINMSLGGSSSSTALQDAINYAWQKGVVVVAAAGNSSSSSPSYPAYYTNVIAVAAIDSNNNKASWSNYGNWVDVAAPGVSIYSSYKGSYANLSGTSMASPFVAGLAGLVWGKGDCSTNTCVRSKIESTADSIAGTGSYWTYGKINAYKAVSSGSVVTTPTVVPTTIPTATPTPTSVPQAKTLTVSSLTMRSSGFSATRTIYANAKVSDSSSNAVISSATVALTITSPSGHVTAFNKNTNSLGEVQVSLRSKEKGIFTTTITNVTKSGYSYSPTTTTTTLLVQ